MRQYVWLYRTNVRRFLIGGTCLLLVLQPIIFTNVSAHATELESSVAVTTHSYQEQPSEHQLPASPQEVQPLLKPTNGQPDKQVKPSTGFDLTWDKVQGESDEHVSYNIRIASELTIEGELVNPDIKTSSRETLPFLETGKGEGRWYWQVQAIGKDREGPWSDVWQVTVDTTAPVIDITEPQSQGAYGGPNTQVIPFRAAAYDARGLKRCIVMQDGAELSTQTAKAATMEDEPATHVNLEANIVASSLSEGIHSIAVIAEDLAGNTQTITREYTVDKTIPQITTGIENNQVVKGIITVSMVIDEPRLQTSSITLLDGDNKVIPLEQIMAGIEDELAVAATNTSTLRWDTRKAVDGTYTLHLYGKDTAGNEATLVRTIVVDNVTPPLGMGVVGTNDSPSVDPLLDQLSKQLTQPFPSPQAFAVTPTAFANVTEAVDEEMLTLSNTPPVPETDRGAPPIAVAPTESGWRILGILWYWWLLAIGALAVVIFKWRPIWQATTLVLRK